MALLRTAGWSGWRAALAGGLLLFAAPCLLLGAEPVQQREVQAVFLLNLTRFVRWPEQAFPAEDAPLVIGVPARDPVGALLADAARGELAGKHPIVTREVQTPADVEGCHVVYFGKADAGEVVQSLALLRSRPVLTVGDSDGFLRLGGHVQLHNRGGQMRLRLEVRNLKRSELVASAQLMRVADIVGN